MHPMRPHSGCQLVAQQALLCWMPVAYHAVSLQVWQVAATVLSGKERSPRRLEKEIQSDPCTWHVYSALGQHID